MNRSEAHAAFAKQFTSGGNNAVTLCECGLCGYVEWVQSCKSEEFSCTVQPMLQYRTCTRCAEVFKRNPELVQWVDAVVRMQIEKKDQHHDNTRL